MRKLAIIGALGALAVSGYADIFNVVSVGTFTLGTGGYTTSEEVVYQNTPSAVDILDFSGTYVGAGADGTMVYTGAGGTVTLAFDGGDFSVDGDGDNSGIAGSWTFVSGTGDYAVYVSGSGTFGATYNADFDNYASTTLSGHLEPVPEPATLAALGLGALVLIRRRKA